jgi:hypothetical protein
MSSAMPGKFREWPYSPKLVILATGIIGLLSVLPLVLVRFPSIIDYPFHMARIVILKNVNSPIYDRFYELGSFLLPNLAMDAGAVFLAQFMLPETASRMFAGLSLLVILVGTVVLHRMVHGRLTLWPLLSIALLHNGIFSFGFFNYLFGLGLAFLAAATWLAMKPGNARLLMAFLWSLVLVLAHLEAFGVFAIIVGSMEIHRAVVSWWQERTWRPLIDLVYSGVPFFLTLALFFIFSPTSGVEHKGFEYSAWLGAKPYGVLYSLSTHVQWLDFFTLCVSIALIGWLLFRRSLSVSKPLVLVAVMMVMAIIVLPHGGLVGASYIDIRLGPALMLLVLVGLNLTGKNSRVDGRIVVLAICILAVVRVGTLSSVWLDNEKRIVPIVRAFEEIEAGSTLFTATAVPNAKLIARTPEQQVAWQPPLRHVGSLAVLSQQVFVVATFANPAMQPLVIEPAYAAIKKFQGNNPIQLRDRKDFRALMKNLSVNLNGAEWPKLGAAYLFVLGIDRLEPLDLPPFVRRVAEGKHFVLLRFVTTQG